MQATIKNVSQAFSFETGISTGVLELQLPDGSKVQALVTDDVMSHMIQLHVALGGNIQEASSPAVSFQPAHQSPAATAHPALSSKRLPDEETPLAVGYAPMTLSNEDGDEEFGGNFDEKDAAPGGAFDAMADRLRQAEEHVDNAVGGASTLGPKQMREVASRLERGNGPMPKPSFVGRVEADEKGNPVIVGAGLVDPQSIIGGNITGEEDVGQI